MKALVLISLISLVTAVCGPGALAQQPSASFPPETGRPNIIVIVADDLGWNDVGYNGSFIRTPNLDRLAAEGARLDHHYALPTCTPTRVALLTGKYPSRYGVDAPDYGEVIDRGDPTLASVLRAAGYSTHIAGKWHLGSPPHTPRQYGFDSSYGYFDGQIDPFTHLYKTGRPSWHRDDSLQKEDGHATDLITREAIRVIRAPSDAPFFLYVAYSVPHYPLDEPAAWTAPYSGYNIHPSRRLYAASVAHMDDGIGRIMEALKETGQAGNSLVIFMSDNGGQQRWHDTAEYGGRYADKPHSVLGDNFPLRGWKGDLYEGGIRVPALVYWRGVIAPGARDLLIHAVDWLPTLCHVANPATTSPLPEGIDGQNLWAALTGQSAPDTTRALYWKSPDQWAVREGPWKLVVTRRDGATAPGSELFNLKEDFRETKDLGASQPARVARLQGLLKAFQANDRK